MQADQKGCDQSNQAHGVSNQAQGSKHGSSLSGVDRGTLILHEVPG
jgi:hypothetical protein